MRLHSLDAIRGIAALIVVGYHLHTVFGGFDQLAYGYFAVDIFFVLSGYVMARTYEPRFANGMGAGSFSLARFRRLWPTMGVGAVIGMLFWLSMGGSPGSLVALFVATLVFVPLPGADPFPLNRPAWSIFFEIFANVCHALFLWRLPIRYLLVVVAVALIAMIPFWAAGNFNLGNKGNDFLGGFPRVLFAYVIGIVLHRVNAQVPQLPEAARPLATYLGALSFPLYAVHYPILQIAKTYSLGPMAGAMLGIVVAALVVWVSSIQFRPSLPKSVGTAA